MRGLVDAQIDVHGPERDLHSGSFGGAVPNPLHALAGLLAGLHDADGRVTLPGFYDKVARAVGAGAGDYSPGCRSTRRPGWPTAGNSGAAAGEAGFSTMERIWARPTAEINGMWGGHTGPGGKTIVPREAHAKLSFRLVAHQEPAEVIAVLRDYVSARTPAGLEVDGHRRRARHAACVLARRLARGPAARRAMERAFGQEVLFTREGGSGPEADLAEILEAPLVFIAVGLDDDRIHAPNERVEMELLLKGAETAAYLWDELRGSRRAHRPAMNSERQHGPGPVTEPAGRWPAGSGAVRLRWCRRS